MASSARGRAQMRETSPERTKVWAEPKQTRRVPVVYYISRNGQLDHPHFMEVPISSDGLFLRDVISRLNLLRGNGMAAMYSWSSKRSYKNGFVWQDLSDDDFIFPAHGQEYVLKGSELLHSAAVSSPGSQDASTASSSSSSDSKAGSFEMPKNSRDDSDFTQVVPATRKKPMPPWKSLDLNEYKVYKNELTAEASVRAAADASTQTDDRRQRWRAQIAREEERNHPCPEEEELGRDEISPPPPSTPSPETLETLIRADRRLLPIPQEDDAAEIEYPSGRMRASAVLMHLISCGSISMKDHQNLPLAAPHYRRRPPPPQVAVGEVPSFPLVRMEDKEYFSGSLIETKKKASAAAGELPALKRSSSYNADRRSKMELAEEIEGVRAKCIPRKPKAAAARKEGSTHGSKRIEPTQTPQI